MKIISKNGRLSLTALIFGAALISSVESKGMESDNKPKSFPSTEERMATISNIYRYLINASDPAKPFIDWSQEYLSESLLLAIMITESNMVSEKDKRSAADMGACASILQRKIQNALIAREYKPEPTI